MTTTTNHTPVGCLGAVLSQNDVIRKRALWSRRRLTTVCHAHTRQFASAPHEPGSGTPDPDPREGGKKSSDSGAVITEIPHGDNI